MPAKNVKELERAVVAIESLNMARYNPRKISKEAMEALENSIESFGMVQEAVVNKPTMTVVGGHQRLKVEVKRKQKNVAVVFVELDEVKEKALNIALNSDHLTGSFTDDLQKLLEEIQSADESLFESLSLDLLMKDLPSFEPEDIESLKRLDGEGKMITCPNCQHEFPLS
jgi:ParB-like chromosome segregation protein Spo0J